MPTKCQHCHEHKAKKCCSRCHVAPLYELRNSSDVTFLIHNEELLVIDTVDKKFMAFSLDGQMLRQKNLDKSDFIYMWSNGKQVVMTDVRNTGLFFLK